MCRVSVVFPQPLSPMITKISPRETVKLIPSWARR